MARPPWTYLFVYSEEVGSPAQVRDFLDTQPQISNWHFYWPGMFLLVSSLTADGLSKLIREKLTKQKGRFLILDTDTDSAGWIPRMGWDLMKEPMSAWEETKKRESGK